MKKLLFAFVTLTMGVASTVQAATLDDYMIVGRYVNDTAVDTSNYELGKISTLDPGNYTAVSSPGVAPSVGQTDDARIAIIDSSGTVKMSDMEVYSSGDTGIDCAGSYSNCTDNGGNLSNTNFNGSAMNDSNGVDGGVDFTDVNNQISTLQTWLGQQKTNAINNGFDVSITTTSGDINTNQVVNLGSGLNIVNFTGVGSNDITVKADLIFQGGADSYAVVFVDDGANFKTSNGNLVIGDGGIGLNNVVIISGNDGTDGSIDISNSYVNGVSLWDLGPTLENNLSVDNMIGCTQLVGDDVDIQNVRMQSCAFDTSVVPIPAAVWLFASGLGMLGWMRRRPVA